MGNVDSIPQCEGQSVNLSQFQILKPLGQGAFSKVYKVQRKQKLYALKVMRKDQCIHTITNIIRERNILECLDHPLVCNMRFAFQNTHCLFMAMDLMSAGDLRFHLSTKQHDENTIKFWIAELICAVKYLHSQSIVHRDIKPENILLDAEGHVHLADFNIACRLPKRSRKLTSMAGTAVYFAPEMFRGEGYDEDVDWWSLGITFYECLYGKRPWTHCTDITQLGRHVLTEDITYPRQASLHCRSALRSLLEKDPKKRLGHGVVSGWHGIARHPFFQHIQWSRIDSKGYQPVYTPIIGQEEICVTDKGDCAPKSIESHVAQRQKTRDFNIQNYASFDYTIFDQYQGFIDEQCMTVGPPPYWVKPAFPGADHNHLPIPKVYLETTPTITI
ncbi:hypothetical protein INT47_006947 [Mucor saturninus]|uniref:Protein kinase domain-containing protein n=1 Tax=Mucor saturninus TaxID=64648 RepID=A0A8H7UVB2_9FUNG|nr:hypothetical protein INT47_006947 [Mucor saturninus]